LGIKELQAIYSCIAFHAGDDPAHHEVVGIKCGRNFRHGCIQFIYNLKKVVKINLKIIAYEV